MRSRKQRVLDPNFTDRVLRKRQPPKMPIAINMVRKLPLVLALHERGIAEQTIMSKTGLRKPTVRAWIEKYGGFASQVVESLRENLDIINTLDAGEEVKE